MSGLKLVAIAMIVLGILGLVYGNFSYTQETEEAKLGPVTVSVDEKKTVNVPVWAGAGAIALGSVILLFGCCGAKKA